MSLDRVAAFLLANREPFFPPKPNVEKRCTRCKIVKQIESFRPYHDKRRSGVYYSSECIECRRAMGRLNMRRYVRRNGVWIRKDKLNHSRV